MTKELKEMIAPRWCEEQKGVFVPLIGKVLEAKNLTSEIMSWYDFMALARSKGKQVPTREELLQMYLQRDEINAILKEHDGDLLEGWFGSSSDYGRYCACLINFGSCGCHCAGKSCPASVRTVVELQ